MQDLPLNFHPGHKLAIPGVKRGEKGIGLGLGSGGGLQHPAHEDDAAFNPGCGQGMLLVHHLVVGDGVNAAVGAAIINQTGKLGR